MNRVNSVILNQINTRIVYLNSFSILNSEREDNEDEEIFLTACDLTTKPTTSMTQMKGCIIKNNTISEEYGPNDPYLAEQDLPFWKKYFCCQACVESFYDSLWMMAVRFSRIAPKSCHNTIFCTLCDMVSNQYQNQL